MRRNKKTMKLTEGVLRGMVYESVKGVLREMEKSVHITWKCDGTEVYVNGIYAGYIDDIGEDAWYGKVFYTNEYGRATMKSFRVTYGKTEIQQKVMDFINDNAENVLSTSIKIADYSHD